MLVETLESTWPEPWNIGTKVIATCLVMDISTVVSCPTCKRLEFCYLQQNIIVSPILLAYTLHSSLNYIQSYKNANYQESHTAKLDEGAGTNLGLKIIHRLHLFTRSNYEATLVPRRTGCYATYQ